MLAKILSQDETGERKVCLISILFKIMELDDNLRLSARGNATCLRVETVSFLNAASSYTFGLGGGSSRAATVSAKPQALWEPSQKGLLAECPQRQRLTVVRPARPNGRPSGSTSSKSPSMRSEPLWFTVILVAAIFSRGNLVSSYRIRRTCPRDPRSRYKSIFAKSAKTRRTVEFCVTDGPYFGVTIRG